MTRRRGGGVKKIETNLACDQFPKCSPQPGTPTDSQGWVEKRRGREEIEVTWGRKKKSQKGERAIRPVITPK